MGLGWVALFNIIIWCAILYCWHMLKNIDPVQYKAYKVYSFVVGFIFSTYSLMFLI